MKQFFVIFGAAMVATQPLQPLPFRKLQDRHTLGIVGAENDMNWRQREPENTYPFPRPLITPTFQCEPQVRVLVALLTIPTETDMREHYRKLNYGLAGNKIKIFFPLGRQRKDNNGNWVDDRTVEEANKHGDILLSDFYDAYEELPQKTIAAVGWFAENCLNVHFLLKLDSDVVINWVSLLRYVEIIDRQGFRKWDNKKANARDGPFWMGHRWDGMSVIHDRLNKNFEDIPREKFPPYHSGPAYMLNRKIAKILLQQRHEISHYLRNEDAMLGILMEPTGIEPSTNRRFVVAGSDEHRRDTCHGPTESIAECACEDWFSYHVGRPGETEVELAVGAVKKCAKARINNIRLMAP